MSFKELDIKPHKKHVDDEKTPWKNGTTVHKGQHLVLLLSFVKLMLK